MKYLKLLVFLIIFIACSRPNGKIKKANECFKGQFTTEEYSELETFLSGFEMFLDEKIGKDDISDNYEGYFGFVSQNGVYGVDTSIVEEIINEISKSLKSKTWHISDGFIKVPGKHRESKEKKYLNIKDEFRSQLINCSCVEREHLEQLKKSVHFSKLETFYHQNKTNIDLNFPLRLYLAIEFMTRVKNSY